MEKDWYIIINGEKVSVSEEVYRAYKRPIWTERKRRKLRIENERSMEALAENGFEISTSVSTEDIVIDRLMIEKIYSILNDKERSLINALYFEKSTVREYALKVGTNHTKIIREHKRIIEKLKYFLNNS